MNRFTIFTTLVVLLISLALWGCSSEKETANTLISATPKMKTDTAKNIPMENPIPALKSQKDPLKELNLSLSPVPSKTDSPSLDESQSETKSSIKVPNPSPGNDKCEVKPGKATELVPANIGDSSGRIIFGIFYINDYGSELSELWTVEENGNNLTNLTGLVAAKVYGGTDQRRHDSMYSPNSIRDVSISPDGMKLAFISEIDSIWVIDLYGNNIEKVVSSSESEHGGNKSVWGLSNNGLVAPPIWSQNGDNIFYRENEYIWEPQNISALGLPTNTVVSNTLKSIDLSTSNKASELLSSSEKNEWRFHNNFFLSPDRKKLAVTEYREDWIEYAFSIYELSNSTFQRKGQLSGFNPREFQWSPNGESIAFIEGDAIYLMNSDANCYKNITSILEEFTGNTKVGFSKPFDFLEESREFYVNWSRDSQKILVFGKYLFDLADQSFSEIRAENYKIGVSDGTLIEKNLFDLIISTGNTLDYSFDSKPNPFSRDSKELLAFERDSVFCEEENRIALINIETNTVKFLTEGNCDSDPIWSPDKSKILFIRSGPMLTGGDTIVIMDKDGNNLTVVPTLPKQLIENHLWIRQKR